MVVWDAQRAHLRAKMAFSRSRSDRVLHHHGRNVLLSGFHSEVIMHLLRPASHPFLMQRSRRVLLLSVLLTPALLSAQVTVDGPVRLVGPEEQRGVDGLAWPVSGSAAVTVEASVASGGFAWSAATVMGDTLELSPDPIVEVPRDGLLLRFPSPADLHGALHLRPGAGNAALPLLRPDGLVPVKGQLIAGRIAEIMKASDRYILLSSPEQGCPPGTFAAHERLCMDAASDPGVLFHDAVAICAERGGKLCAWDEYIAACTLLQAQLTGLFDEWEWIDESSNHTHGADQAGRLTCASQRNQGVLAERIADVRCCYHPR
jgi:hypothetical protein